MSEFRLVPEIDDYEMSLSMKPGDKPITGSPRTPTTDAIIASDRDKVEVPAPNQNQPPGALNERHALEFTIIVVGATALAFNAGFINGCTLQFRNIAVSHVTGTSTHAGLNLANNDWENFSLCICLISCFIFGSSITGVYLPQSSFKLGIQYGPLFLIGSVFLLVACVIAHVYPNSYWYFYFAAMASGLQNALTTRYSGNIIRTTHMTGTATDIGLVLGRICKGETHEFWKLKLLVPIYVSFIGGGAASVLAFRKMGKLALIINVIVFFSIGLSYSILVGTQLHIPIWKAFFGTYAVVGRSVRDTSELAKVAIIKSTHKLKKFSQKLRGSSYDETGDGSPFSAGNPMHETPP